ncbi:MAG TPA: class I SAM-dependent methyltransferase [Gammaproteobacteria bacterium]|nr:class I SAM-dependent methyltransferase [Gammaproteobacteria bacterium]
MQSEIIAANIAVHNSMIDVYHNEPHFRPENKAKVRAVLEKLKMQDSERLLDLGCGTGFIIDLAKHLFTEIHGVDVTPAMLNKVDVSSGNIILHNVAAESLPFPNEYFDVITAYAFLHHTENYSAILQEAFRVLKKGGKFYVDLEPNKLFWQAMKECEQMNKKFSDIVEREIDAVLHIDEKIEKEFSLSKDIFNKAEYTKSFLGGIDPEEFHAIAKHIGYSSCQEKFEWFLGQGTVMHGQSFRDADIVEQYLRKLLPLSAKFFKYLQFILVK